MLNDVRGEIAPHRRRPERVQVFGDAPGGLLVRERLVVDGDLVGHAGQGFDAHRQTTVAAPATFTLSGADRVGETSTAVTLYSGQFVAQSEYSVVTTLAPLSGWWNVV